MYCLKSSWMGGGGLLAALSAGPTPAVLPPQPGGNPVVVTAISSQDATQGQPARRLPNGEVEPAVGNGDGSGNNIIGVYAAAVTAGQMVTIVEAGFLAMPGLPTGPLFRSATGTLVSHASLPTLGITYTNYIGVGSAIGLDVHVGQQQQVA